MPIETFVGDTFVAYLDISGFKELMKKGEKAKKALGFFYSTIYKVGERFCAPDNPEDLLDVNAALFSDCALLFPRIPQSNLVRAREDIRRDRIKGLRSILAFIQRVNQHLILSKDVPIMTICSIDYGKFRYEDRIEFEGIDKGFVVGKPFVNAFLDVERGKPKIQPGECRLLKDNLNLNGDLPRNPSPLSLLMPTRRHYYFHWMLPNLAAVERFEQEFQDTYQLKYAGMIQVLQKYASSQQEQQNPHRHTG